MKDAFMSTNINTRTPTQAEIDTIIEQAHQMRSEYLARSIKAGFATLRGLFVHKKTADNVTV